LAKLNQQAVAELMAEQFNDVAECRPASGVLGYKFENDAGQA
jgi:hypothetical protein